LRFGVETPEDDELMTYIIFAEAYGWSPRDIENRPWSKVIKLRELVLEMMRMKRQEIERSTGKQFF